MEGDAGASRLNPADADVSSSEVTSEDSTESEVGTDHTNTEVTSEDSTESEVGTDHTNTEVTSEDSTESEVGTDHSATDPAGLDPSDDERTPSRLGRGWLVTCTVVLLALAAGIGVGGYLSLRSNQQAQLQARHDAAAVEDAKGCVAATQAPDVAVMATSQEKIINCGTGDFRAQAVLYSSLLLDAYRAANAHVQVSDMRAAAERTYADGSVDVLVALRVAVNNGDAQNQETGYRLRVRMEPADGRYKIAKLDQVAAK